MLMKICRLLAICWLVSACSLTGESNEDWPLLTNRKWSPTQSSSLDVQYIQVGSILIRYGDDYLLTDPFFSNPPPWQVLLFRKLAADPDAARSLIVDWQGIRGVLVGHGHYDHVLDAPFVLEQTDPATRLYGSQTVVNMLRPSVSKRRLQAVAAEDRLLKADWIKVPQSPFRFRAILSEHSPPIFSCRVFGCTVERRLTEPPRHFLAWKEGQTLAYLIDVMPDETQTATPRYRIFVQSSASNPPKGFPSEGMLKQKTVDLAIISAANFDKVQKYPEKLLNHLNPKHVMIVHYEPFWKPVNTSTIELLPELDMNAFLERVYGCVDDPNQVHLPLATSILAID